MIFTANLTEWPKELLRWTGEAQPDNTLDFWPYFNQCSCTLFCFLLSLINAGFRKCTRDGLLNSFLAGATHDLTVVLWREKELPRKGQLFSLWIIPRKFHSRAGRYGAKDWPRLPARKSWVVKDEPPLPWGGGRGRSAAGLRRVWARSGFVLLLEVIPCVVGSLCYPQVFYLLHSTG